jgi:hypothetical protein
MAKAPVAVITAAKAQLLTELSELFSERTN